jgi:hypothetical protein
VWAPTRTRIKTRKEEEDERQKCVGGKSRKEKQRQSETRIGIWERREKQRQK